MLVRVADGEVSVGEINGKCTIFAGEFVSSGYLVQCLIEGEVVKAEM